MAVKFFEDSLLSNEYAHKIGQRLHMTPVVMPPILNIPAKEWLDGEEAEGLVIIAAIEKELVFYFGDPNTAFNFKMRFA